jgi:hypothetical protein
MFSQGQGSVRLAASESLARKNASSQVAYVIVHHVNIATASNSVLNEP